MIIYRNDSQVCSDLAAPDLPGDDVGMMFDGGKNDFVSGTQKSFAVTCGYQIDGFSCTPNKNNFLRIARAEKPLHFGACLFISFGCFFAEIVNAAMNV